MFIGNQVNASQKNLKKLILSNIHCAEGSFIYRCHWTILRMTNDPICSSTCSAEDVRARRSCCLIPGNSLKEDSSNTVRLDAQRCNYVVVLPLTAHTCTTASTRVHQWLQMAKKNHPVQHLNQWLKPENHQVLPALYLTKINGIYSI